MTVSMQITKRIYQGNGVTRHWDVDFPLISAEDLSVYLTSPQGAEEEIYTDFSLDLLTHTLTYPTEQSGKTPLPEGWKITLLRSTPITQEIDLLRQGELDAEVLEQGYDKLTLLIQELGEKVNRSIRYPVSSQESDLETEKFLTNILDAKQDAQLASTQAASSALQAQETAATAQQTIALALSNFNQETQEFSQQLQEYEQTVYDTAQTYVDQTLQQSAIAKNWATKTDAAVEGNEYSAKKYAQQAASSAAAASSVVQNKISNCLTKIPQDINLQLSASGTLTLKGGSKVYLGNGSTLAIEQDISGTRTSSQTCLVFINNASFLFCPIELCFSGITAPTLTQSFGVWYDTANNIVKYTQDTGSNWTGNMSMPVCITTSAGGKITSIDQVFNGMGYIGSVVFGLPGIEGLAPNGRNSDGSLNNISVKLNNFFAYENNGPVQDAVMAVTTTNTLTRYTMGIEQVDVLPANPVSLRRYYVIPENKMYSWNGTSFVQELSVPCAFINSAANSQITSLEAKNPFKAVDYNDFTQLADKVYKRNTVYSSEGSNATITFETPIAVQEGRYLEVVYTARGKTYTSIIPAVFATLGIVVGSLNWGGDQTDRDFDCVMNVTVSGGYITAFTSLGRDIYIKRVDVVDYYVRS